MKPLKLKGVSGGEEVIIGFCETCGSPVTRDEAKEVRYDKRELKVISCDYC